LHKLHLHTAARRSSERGFALLLVILILTGMLIIGVPFAVSMRLSKSRSRTALANAHARFAAEGAYNHAIACLMRTQEQYDPWPRTRVRDEDTTLFESHTLDIPAELAVTFGDEDPDLDLTGELDTCDPRGSIWSVEVEDEQGKINLNSASRALLMNLIHLLGPDDSADDAAAALVDYRRDNGGFNTVSEAQAVLRNTGDFKSGQLANFSSYVTVSSERLNPGAPHPININTAPELVLIANMINLRLRAQQAVPGEDNEGNGALSPIRVDQGTPDGDWKLELTDDPDDADDEADHANLYYRSVTETTWPTAPETAVPLNAPITHNGLEFTVYSGTVGFAADDVFYFSTRRITEDLARDMAEALKKQVTLEAGVTGTPGGGIVEQDFNVVNDRLLGDNADEGNLAIGADVMTYTCYLSDKSWGPHLYRVVNHDREYDQGELYQARQIIPDHRGLGILCGVLDDKIEDSYAINSVICALKLNAFRPLSAELENATAPFCFTTCDTYTVIGRGSVNDQSGNELAAGGIKKIISIKRPTPVIDDSGDKTGGVWTVDTQSAFDRLVTAKSGHHFCAERGHYDAMTLSMPTNFRYEDADDLLLPSIGLPSRKLSDVAINPCIYLHFGGHLCVLSNAAAGLFAPLALLPYGTDDDHVQNTNATATNEEGMLFKKGWEMLPDQFAAWPRLAYSTQHAPIPTLGSTCKSIEMWVRPEQTKAEEDDGDPPWSDDDRDYFLFDTSLPYCGLDDSPDETTLRQLCHQNRIAIFYSGSTEELVFRISDAAMSAQSAEVRYRFPPEADNWYHVKAIWSGMAYGEMTLLIDGKAPDGTDGDDEGAGRYYPRYNWPDIAGLSGPVITGNQIFEAPDTSISSRGTTADKTPQTGDPVTVHGYDIQFQQMHYTSDPEDFPEEFYNDLAAYGGGELAGSSAIGADVRTTVDLSKTKGGTILPNAGQIPVHSTEGFQDKGFLRIGSNEIVYYERKTNDSFDCTCMVGAEKTIMRGVDIMASGFGPNLPPDSTGVTTEPQEITTELAVVPISIYVSDNRAYPTPRYFIGELASTASVFGIPHPRRNYVRIDGKDADGENAGEFIGYTHKPGTEFLVDVDAGSGGGQMRGQHGTQEVSKAKRAIWPVYQLGHSGPGGPGQGDRVTILDDNLAPGNREIEIHTSGSGRNYVSFDSTLPPCLLKRVEGEESANYHPRMVKFPATESNPGGAAELNLGKFFSIGTNSGPKVDYDSDAPNPFKMDMPAEATIDEFKVSLGDGTIGVPRVTQASVSLSGLDLIKILSPSFWDEDFDLSSGGSAVGCWPTQGYAQIGDEIVYYRTLYRHNIQENETGAGAVCTSSSNVQLNNTVSVGETGSITWSPGGQDGIDPSEAGFCKEGGYLRIESYTPPTWQDGHVSAVPRAAVDQLMAAGLLTPEQLEDWVYHDEDGTWTKTTEGGYSGGGWKREVIKYEQLSQAGADWVFSGIHRGLFGTTAQEHAPSDNPETEETHYPQLTSRIAELQIIQRGCLGTTPARHPVGSKVVPLYHIVSTFMTGPLGSFGDPKELDKLYVESNANFPHRGYLLVSDGTDQEIIGYTSKGYDEEEIGGETVRKPFFAGVAYLRKRFGTPPVQIGDLSTIDLSSMERPPDVNCRRGVVRLYEPRYDDRLPIDPNTGQFAWKTGDVNIEGNPAYLEITRTIRGARWESITWAEGPNATWDNPFPDETGRQIFVLARIDGEPDWTDDPVLWSDYDPDDGPAILKFDEPTDDPATNNRIDIEGDTLELRIYFGYTSDYVDGSGKIKQWLSPVLRGLKIGYSAPSSVYEQEEVRF